MCVLWRCVLNCLLREMMVSEDQAPVLFSRRRRRRRKVNLCVLGVVNGGLNTVRRRGKLTNCIRTASANDQEDFRLSHFNDLSIYQNVVGPNNIEDTWI